MTFRDQHKGNLISCVCLSSHKVYVCSNLGNRSMHNMLSSQASLANKENKVRQQVEIMGSMSADGAWCIALNLDMSLTDI